ncbi:MAG: thioredoxin family protein, partial [Gammaproteobacteria bacterium]|nr:thioredoxin family protein [Gammaproteobacteria bacterium]
APLTIPLAIQATAPATAASAAVATATPAATAATAAVAPAPARHQALGVLLALALLGGMVLNLMPCVLPVLSIKALGFVEQARRHPHEVRMKGLAFAAGVVASMLALAGALLLLRAGGEQIGWGFQLQSPLFVTLMAYMLLLVGLNLSGVFEIGGGFAGVGEGLTHGDDRRASFFTGVLTTLVATPCTAPFMAAAVGAALTQPPVIALAIFGTLGLGLALPILLLSYAPWLQRLLPKPGAWMATLKQLFAFPMYASAAWLLWVLAQQTSAIGLGAALAGLVLVALAAWAYQTFKTSSGRLGKLAAAATAVAALIAAVWLPTNLEGAPRIEPAAAVNDAGWQPYDPARIATLRAAGRPILIDFTASWCLTCLVNERNTFSEAAVRAVFRDRNVALFKGDWTRQDPRITRALAHFGRAGVPLYVVYNGVPGSTKAVVLPQVLTASIVEGAFAALPGGTPH